jgi:beta-lactamase class D
MVSLSHLSQTICGIGFAIFTYFPATANAENLPNTTIIDNSQPSQATLKISANKIDFKNVFQKLGIEGSIIIYDASNNKLYEHNAPRNSKAFFPASTFKIFNTLVALETGVIRDEVTVLTWDGIKREIDVWNRDTNLRQAFKDSTVWFYQILARKAGQERMQKFINQAGYGNQQIGTAEQIDKFWLEGPLQITPKQQIEFLQKLYSGRLPFSQRSLNLLKDIMIIEQTPNYTLRGKTGWVTSQKPNIGWFVGYLEQNNKVYFLATNIDMPSTKLAKSRIEITRRCLKMLGLLSN